MIVQRHTDIAKVFNKRGQKEYMIQMMKRRTTVAAEIDTAKWWKGNKAFQLTVKQTKWLVKSKG